MFLSLFLMKVQKSSLKLYRQYNTIQVYSVHFSNRSPYIYDSTSKLFWNIMRLLLTLWYPRHSPHDKAFPDPWNTFRWQDLGELDWYTEVPLRKWFSNEIFPVHLVEECGCFLATQCLLYPVLPSAMTSRHQSVTMKSWLTYC